MKPTTKARYWTFVLYPDSMIDDWQNQLDMLIQFPYCYCIHNADITKGKEDRKVHVHFLVAFPNTTTYNAVLKLSQRIQPNNQYVENVLNVRYMYDYLIHDTENCKKQKKHKYSPTERVSGNNFDIGAYEQISASEKKKILANMSQFIIINKFTNFVDFQQDYLKKYGEDNIDIIISYSGYLERLLKGNYYKHYQK